MSRTFSQVIILAEDKRHQNFVVRYLRRRRYKNEIFFEKLPSGSGCGEQWVRENYARSVGAYRARARKARTALIVVIDADTGDVIRRTRQLQEALGKDARKDDEEIVHLIPRRNIETWILHLTGEDVDEEEDYKNSDVDRMIPAAAKRFHDWTSQPPAECLPSLTDGLQETKRLQ